MKRFLRLETLIAVLLAIQMFILFDGFSAYQSEALETNVWRWIFRLAVLYGLLLLVVLLMFFQSLRKG